MRVNLEDYENRGYRPGGGVVARMLWYWVNAAILNSWLVPSYSIKRSLLRLFGAKIGDGVVIKPRVNVKYPWRLVVGDNVWIGEGVWIDNLANVRIGSNVCLSQDVYLLTGNHDYKDSRFGLFTEGITIEDGAWVGARCTVCPGVNVSDHVVVSVGSILSSKETESHGIYRGNPASLVKKRTIE